MSRTAVITILVAFVVAAGGLGYYLYSKDQEPPVIYETEKPFYTDIVKKTVATGSVVPRKEIEIKPQISGLIQKLYVEPGDRVKEGDLIATVKVIPNMVTLNEAENRLSRAKIALTNAEREYNRNKPLFEEGVISQTTYYGFQVDFETAKQEVEAARENLEIVRKGTTQKLGKTANTNVRATIFGMVLDVPVEEGNSVIEANTFNDGTTIAILADMNEMIFKGNVDESEVGKIRPGMELLLTIGAIEQERFTADLEYIAPKGVEENGAIQFEIRAAVELREDQFIRAGYSANADIVLDRRDSVLAIQEALIRFDGERPWVEIEEGSQQFERVYIETGLSDGINIEVLEGIEPGDRIKNPNKTRS